MSSKYPNDEERDSREDAEEGRAKSYEDDTPEERAIEEREIARVQASARQEYQEQSENVARMKASGAYDRIMTAYEERDARAAMFAAAGVASETDARNTMTLADRSADIAARLAGWQAQLDATWTSEQQAAFMREQIERQRKASAKNAPDQGLLDALFGDD
jgi:hypothetical protein